MQRMSVIDGEKTFTSGCSGGAVFTTQDGMIFCITNYKSDNSDDQGTACDSYNTTPCATDTKTPNLWIDVNGLKKPNVATTSSKRPKDIYQAMIYSQKVVPFEKPTQEVMYDANTEGAVGYSSQVGKS